MHTKPGDVMKNSIWTDQFKMPEFPQLKRDLKTDVLIVGGGLAGILCAHALAGSGVDCVLIEADRICQGVTGNTTAKITSQHGLIYGKIIREFGEETARRYWEANEMAIREFQRLAKNAACDLQIKDNYIYATENLKALEAEMKALDRLEIPAKFVQDLPLPLDTVGAICFPKQAQFNPLKLVSGIAKELNIYERTPARSFDKNRVLTDHGTITASKIIVATHFPVLNKHGNYFLKMYQQRSYVLALDNGPLLDGMYLDGDDNGLSFRNYGDLLLVGGGGHRTGKKGGAWEELEVFTRRKLPKAKEVCRWATQDCMTLDGIPYIGQYSKRTPDLYVITGFNKWGMTSSMVASMVINDLVQGKENPYAAVFSPSRTVLRSQLFTNGFEAVLNLLTPTKPRCPHMGCALKWNPQEHSWDCPCHGSRFARDGSLQDNPATRNLKKS